MLELLLAMLLGVVVLAAGLASFQMHGGVARQAQALVSATSGASFALEVVARDLQLAGADPAAASIESIAAASADSIVLQSDLDGDGVVDAGSAERVTLAWSAASGGRLLRWLGHQPMSLAAVVAPGGFGLRYFDAYGGEIATGGGSLDAAARARVQRVEVRIAVEERFGSERKRVALETAAALRSRVATGES